MLSGLGGAARTIAAWGAEGPIHHPTRGPRSSRHTPPSSPGHPGAARSVRLVTDAGLPGSRRRTIRAVLVTVESILSGVRVAGVTCCLLHACIPA